MKTERPDISIVSVTYNGLEDTLRMIRSLHDAVRSVSYELIVVDNGSLSDEAAAIKRAYPGVTTLRSERNLGFAGGNNLGLDLARGRYVLLLNNDTYLLEDGLGKMVEWMDSHPEVGACSPKIRYAFGQCPIQFAGFTPLTHITLRNSLIGNMEEDRGQYDLERPTPYAHGAAMMLSREALQESGLLPEKFFLYYEELDWSMTIAGHGYQIWYLPFCTVFHRDGQVGRPLTPRRAYYLMRSRLLLAFRKRRGVARVLSLCYLGCVAVPKAVVAALMKGRWEMAFKQLGAMRDFLTMDKKEEVRYIKNDRT